MNDKPTPLASKNQGLIERLRAFRDVADHTANNGWRRKGPSELELCAADEIERLTRERDANSDAIDTLQSDRYRLRTALERMIAWFRSRSGSPEGMLRVSQAEDALRSAERGAAPERQLSASEAASISEAFARSPRRAYYETHEPPHCPTCGCGSSPEPTK